MRRGPVSPAMKKIDLTPEDLLIMHLTLPRQDKVRRIKSGLSEFIDRSASHGLREDRETPAIL